MKAIVHGLTLFLAIIFTLESHAFTVSSKRNVMNRFGFNAQQHGSFGQLRMGFLGGDEESKKLTRDNEPDQYFATNTDKMSDQEKIPIAVGGLLFISLPFILGLIALYASK